MPWVLIVITVFSTSAGVSTQTAFQQFTTQSACERARDGVTNGIDHMKGTLGRDVFAACYPKS